MKPLAWILAFGLTAPAGKVINFDTAQPGKTPPGWTVAMTNRGGAPRWEILKDQTASTQPYVFAQISTDPTENRFPLAILDESNLRDGELSVRIKPVAGRADQSGGLVWRYRDANNYYLARANALSQDVAVYKVENGFQIPILPLAKHDIPVNGWSILKVWVRGNRFQVYLDHRRILQGQDDTFRGPGKVGLWTVADSVTYFDDFRIYPR
jgi:hypothetical protein